ncbi:MAG TPA: elongation factor G [Anaerolineae bacterium]|nr:elongation factor G [Anaerolineae bacterium]
MKEFTTDKIRNVALLSHNGAGTTTFVERALFFTNAINRMGSTQKGTAVMDFEEEEIERNGSIATALAHIEWRNTKINILDTPGYVDFIGEVNAALAVADGAMIFVDAMAGVEVGTEVVWQAAKERNLPRVLVINKMDRDNARVQRVYKNVVEHLDGNFVPLQIPIGEGPDFKGVIDLLAMQCRLGDNDERQPIPDDMLAAAKEARAALVEAAAEGDDTLIEKFLEDIPLDDDEVLAGLKSAMQQDIVVPVLYSAPEAGIAVGPMLGALSRLMPAPNEAGPFTVTNEDGSTSEYEVSDDSPLTAFVFKTREDPYGKLSYLRIFGGILESDSRVENVNREEEVRVGSLQILRGKEQLNVPRLHSGDIGVVVKLGDTETNDTLTAGTKHTLPPTPQPHPISSFAIHAVSQSDVAKLSQSLNRLVDEDPTLSWHTETATHETILSGMGVTHLNVAIKKAESKFGIHLTTTIPTVPYKETVTKTSSAEYTHKKQTGGAGQYARVFLRVEPSDDEEFAFESEIFGGAISAPFVAATEKGCRQALEAGPLAGFPVTGVKAVVYDGKEHPVDSKEIAFQVAGRECIRKAMLSAGPMLLEPIYSVTITVPADNMGDILGDLNTRRAHIQGMDQEGTKSIIRAEVPLAEMQSYQADLRSMTQGRGVFGMQFHTYGRVPTHVQEQIVAKLKKDSDE